MSDSETNTGTLFSEFEPVTTEEWEKVLTRDLKGADYKKKLKWESIEGIEVLPFYRKEDLENLPHLSDGVEINTPAEWQFCEVINRADPAEANKAAKEAIDGGADSVQFTIQIDPDEGVLGGDITGTHVQNLEDLKTLLDGINPEKTGVVFDSGVGSVGLLGLLKALLNDSDATSSGSDDIPEAVSFLFDPFTYMAHRGRLPLPEKQLNSFIEQMAARTGGHTLAADGAFYHNCGATIIQELGIALSIGSEFLARVPEGRREQTAKQFWMHLSAGSLYFPEIAKFRAARLLWTRILDAYNLDPDIPLTIHASTSKWNKAIADPHSNMLRATTEATAAAVGGANRISVHPYNAQFEQTDEFSRRIARNVSHILDEEAHLSATENPGDGSYYVEVLTDEIAKKAWAFFQLIEKQGGVQKALEANIIQSEVGKSRKAKEQALATRELVMTGVNNYPDSEQELPHDLFQSSPVDSLHRTEAEPTIDTDTIIDSLSKAFADKAAMGDVVTSFLEPQKQLYVGLKPYRAAKPFEEIRLETQKIATERGKSIKVQLVPIGNKKMRKARATFSQNFLSCAGFQVDNPLGYEAIEEAADELSDSDADIYVLCGSDEEYPDLVESFCDHFSNGPLALLAGNPKQKAESYNEAGIDFFIYMGVNMIEVLEEIQDKIGVGSE
ncbi:MAG TPA: methylmalonyl-CoA mutase family protein [Balneolaceae bacterium]|nr:methylmalonyl-CoA mutase family protein [Balneolaceae bacterium]